MHQLGRPPPRYPGRYGGHRRAGHGGAGAGGGLLWSLGALVSIALRRRRPEKYFLLWHNLVTKPSLPTWLDNSCWSSSLIRCSNPVVVVVVAVALRCWGPPTACPAQRDSAWQTRLASHCCCWSALCPPHWCWNSETKQSHDGALKTLSQLSKVFTVWCYINKA